MALKKDFNATGAAFSFARSAFSGATACNKPTRNTPAPTATTLMGFGFGSGK
jgi:hypothetical protein